MMALKENTSTFSRFRITVAFIIVNRIVIKHTIRDINLNIAKCINCASGIPYQINEERIINSDI